MKTRGKSWFHRGYFGYLKHQLEEFKDYVLELEQKFKSDMERLGKQLDDELEKRGGDSTHHQDIIDWYADDFQRIDKVFIRTFRYSAIVSIYSTLESSMNSICTHLLRLKCRTLELSNLKGEGIERAKLCLETVCAVDFPENTASWSEIQKLIKIRNCIVHAEGNIEIARSPQKLINIVQNTKGLEIEGKRYIKIEGEYLEAVINSVENFLEELCKRAFGG
jgi:hypothetical protein